MEIIVCTICSREKNSDKGLLPANVRYAGSHIAEVKKIADGQKLPYFILSGVYGLIFENEEIPYYDHLLLPEEINLISKKVRNQLQNLGAQKILFYAKNKQNWEPYREVMMKATEALGVTLEINVLPQ